MTQDEIINTDEILRMAREAGFAYELFDTVQEGNGLERFAALVAEATKAQPQVEPVAELQHKYDELLEHYTWQGNQYMQAMRNKAAEIEASIEATKEKAAKVCEEFTANMRHQSTEAHNFALECSKAIREMK